MAYFTDYPIVSFGDVAHQIAPIRKIDRLLCWDGNKYCAVLINGVCLTIKYGYIYKEHGRLGEVPAITSEDLKSVPRSPNTVDL